ncbi:MAG: putative selenium-dependent hydroxylase accessory protein YqeC [Caldilineales bacterium]|nr:putative selenium-dependent hydroxylase accessory protein YqeC [Caldilineales bacterium]
MDLSHALRVELGSVVAFTGAGGKTTAMLRLGRELAATELTVIATATTRLGIDQLQLFPGFLIDPDRHAVANILAKHRFIAIVRELDASQGKALGFGPERIAALREIADVVLVEADGSRRFPLKAPAEHEPVIPPDATHVVCCAHLAALGQPLDADHVHRPEIVARLTGLNLGDAITPAAFARLLLHPDGPARGVPKGAGRYFLLNGVDQMIEDSRLKIEEEPSRGASIFDVQSLVFPDATHRLALRLGAAPGINSALFAQAAHEPPVLASYGKTTAVVLAAGASTRFGSPKQLADWQGQPLIRHVVMQALAAPVQQVIVVLGAYFDEIAPVLAGLPVSLLYNPDWRQGQSASMQAGLRACDPQTQAALFMLGDQPHQPASLTTAMIETHRRTLAPIVWPEHEGRRGNPVLFDRALFGRLHQVEGDRGGRALFEQFGAQTVRVQAGPEILIDVDEPRDLMSDSG